MVFTIGVISLLLFWCMGTIIYLVDDKKTKYWATGIIYPTVLLITYPVRAVSVYKKKEDFYKKHGITMMQFIMGKRARRK